MGNKMMIHAAINILLLSVLLLIVGLWRPKILLFWLDEPNRFAIVMMFLVLVIIGVTLFGEGSRQKQLKQESLPTEKEIFIDSPTVTEVEQSTDTPIPLPEG
jgi:hypothetical protein